MDNANQAQAPRGINHLVLNVRNMEVSHKFWTEVLGFKCVAALKQVPGGRKRPNMRSEERRVGKECRL